VSVLRYYGICHDLSKIYFVHDLLGDARGTSEHITSSDMVSEY